MRAFRAQRIEGASQPGQSFSSLAHVLDIAFPSLSLRGVECTQLHQQPYLPYHSFIPTLALTVPLYISLINSYHKIHHTRTIVIGYTLTPAKLPSLTESPYARRLYSNPDKLSIPSN